MLRGSAGDLLPKKSEISGNPLGGTFLNPYRIPKFLETRKISTKLLQANFESFKAILDIELDRRYRTYSFEMLEEDFRINLWRRNSEESISFNLKEILKADLETLIIKKWIEYADTFNHKADMSFRGINNVYSFPASTYSYAYSC